MLSHSTWFVGRYSSQLGILTHTLKYTFLKVLSMAKGMQFIWVHFSIAEPEWIHEFIKLQCMSYVTTYTRDNSSYEIICVFSICKLMYTSWHVFFFFYIFSSNDIIDYIATDLFQPNVVLILTRWTGIFFVDNITMKTTLKAKYTLCTWKYMAI